MRVVFLQLLNNLKLILIGDYCYDIKENIFLILNEIEESHKKSNFSKFSVPKLVAVSKKQNEEKVIDALEAGHKYFRRKQSTRSSTKMGFENTTI